MEIKRVLRVAARTGVFVAVVYGVLLWADDTQFSWWFFLSVWLVGTLLFLFGGDGDSGNGGSGGD